jgi:hypothetical protein
VSISEGAQAQRAPKSNLLRLRDVDVCPHRPDATFPLDLYGRPTFKPSAGWYLTQIEFQVTPRPIATRLSSVATSGDDLVLNKRVEGDFFDEFDGLTRFPFDSQARRPRSATLPNACRPPPAARARLPTIAAACAAGIGDRLRHNLCQRRATPGRARPLATGRHRARQGGGLLRAQ